MSKNETKRPSFPIKLFGYIRGLETEAHLIPKQRKQQLLELSRYISQKIKKGESPKAMVICTHNSRRSQMAQLWLKTAAIYYGLNQVKVFSGGTEATAFHPNAVAAMRRAGLDIEQTEEGGDNPFYECSITAESNILVLFSKKYDNPNNPKNGFAAVMVCSEADAACPVVAGAEKRFAIRYDDPKEMDGTEGEAAAYDERCRQIGREMFFVVRGVRG